MTDLCESRDLVSLHIEEVLESKELAAKRLQQRIKQDEGSVLSLSLTKTKLPHPVGLSCVK